MRKSNLSPVDRRRFLGSGFVIGSAAVLLSIHVAADPPVAHGKTQGNPVLGDVGGVHHVAVRTRDWDGTLAFYQKGLGCTVKMAWGEAPNRWAYLDIGDGTYIEIAEDLTFVAPSPSDSDPTKMPGDTIIHLGLRTNRIDAAHAQARAFGAKSSSGPVDVTLNTTTGQGPVLLRVSFFQGPNGEWIELLQSTPSGFP